MKSFMTRVVAKSVGLEVKRPQLQLLTTWAGKSFTLNLPPLARRKIRTVTVTCRSRDAVEIKLVYVCKSALKTATVAQMLLFTEEMSLTH